MKNKFYVSVVKVLFVMPLFLFGLWLLQMLYFPGVEARKSAALQEPAGDVDIFRRILIDRAPVPRGHFHMIDEDMAQPEPFQPCLTCHGTFPHGKEEKVRSILNSHTGFLACAVCHVRKDAGQKDFSFLWVDSRTGITSLTVQGEYGKYPAKIFPTTAAAEGEEKIIRPVSEESAKAFLKHKDQYTPDQIAQAKMKLHERLSKKPVFCAECHKKAGYLDFAKLGFPRNRVDHLISSEVAGMIENYETFYLPEVIDFGVEKD